MDAYAADTCKCWKAFPRPAVGCRKEQSVGWKKAVPVPLSVVAVAARIPAPIQWKKESQMRVQLMSLAVLPRFAPAEISVFNQIRLWG